MKLLPAAKQLYSNINLKNKNKKPYRYQKETGKKGKTVGQTLRSGEIFLFLKILFGKKTSGPHTERGI